MPDIMFLAFTLICLICIAALEEKLWTVSLWSRLDAGSIHIPTGHLLVWNKHL